MWFDRLWDCLSQEVFNFLPPPDSVGKLFNPYHRQETEADLPRAGVIRRANLHAYLASLPEQPQVLLVGEAPGWHGCRFSGVPFTSEAQLVSGELPFRGRRTSTFPTPAKEASAQTFWRVMSPYHPRFFVWNSLPFHPHLSGNPTSNRHPARSELRDCLPLFEAIWTILSPVRVIGVGRCAQWALSELGIRALPVRHPARGGGTAFRLGIEAVL
jgi:uracil-DNA glycosylase